VTTIPFATQDLGSPNENIGGVVRPPQGMVLHIAQGTYQGTVGWEHNPAAQVSSYCVVAKTGAITQVIDLDNKAWTESGGNDAWIGVEFEGFVPDALTPQQITAAAQILAWLHTEYGVPIQATDDPINGHGLGYHSMGGTYWGGHFQCPGPAIIAQRPEILYQAEQFAQPKDKVVPQFNPPVVVDPVVADLGHAGGAAATRIYDGYSIAANAVLGTFLDDILQPAETVPRADGTNFATAPTAIGNMVYTYVD
jgi:hypothetical protein